MTPDPRLDADLRALAASLRRSADFADRVTARVAALPPPRRSRSAVLVLAGVGCLGMIAFAAVVLVTLYLSLGRPPAPGPRPGPDAGGPTSEARPAVAYSLSAFAYTNSRWGFIDRTGKVVVPARYSRATEFSDGLAAVKTGGTHAAGGKWGYIDRTGAEVVAPRFDWARPFQNGYAGVRVGEKWGFIDRAGKVVVEPRFTAVERFSGGLVAVEEGGVWGYIGPDGGYRLRPQFAWAVDFSEGLAAVRDRPAKEGEPGRWRYIDATGATVIELPPDCDYAGPFSEERAAVSRGGVYGLIDRTGRFVVAPRFDRFEAFRGGRAWASYCRRVKAGAHAGMTVVRGGYVAADGTELGPFRPAYDNGIEIDPTTGRLSALEVDEAGRAAVVTAIDFDRLRPTGGLYRVHAPKRVGMMTVSTAGFVDRTGRVVIPPTLEDVGDFHEGLAAFAVGLDWEAVAAAERHHR